MNTTKLKKYALFSLLCGLLCLFSLPVMAQRGTFRVTLNGYFVTRETNEGITLDGSGDELTLVSHVGTVDSSGRINHLIWGLIFTSVMNGLHTNHGFPSDAPWLRTNPVINANPPAALFEGDIVQNTNAALIIPTIWEWDGVRSQNLMRNYADRIDADQNGLGSEVARMITTPTSLELEKYLRDGTGMRINNTMSLIGGVPQDRPVGMQSTAFNQFGFTPQVLVLTFQAADFISRTNFGKGIGVVPVHYVDASGLGGDYTLYLQVERLDAPAACAPDFTSTFTGTAELTTDNKHAPGPFTQNISLTVDFSECRTVVRITNFPTVATLPFPVTIGSDTRQNVTTVTQTGGGTGNFNALNGRLEIPVTLHFEHSLGLKPVIQLFARPSDLNITLTTQGKGDKKDTATGNLVLFGSGVFSGGFLGSSNGTLRITGSFSPRP